MGFFEETGISDDNTRDLAKLMSQEGQEWAQDNKLIVKFYTGHLLNNTKTQLAGRPIFDDLEKVRILKVGERDYVDKGANPEYIRRFKKQYDAFKAGQEAKQSGTPLSMWPLLKSAQVAELMHFNVNTVEQLAEMPDVHLQKFMGGNALKRAAQEYVSRAATQAPIMAMQGALEARDTKIAAMTAQMEQMSVVLAGLQAQQGLRESPAAAVASAPPGVIPYSGMDFPVSPDALPAPVAAPRRRGRPPKAAVATE